MKKLITLSFIFLALVIFISSCKKTSESPNIKPKILEYEQGPGNTGGGNCGECLPRSGQDSIAVN